MSHDGACARELGPPGSSFSAHSTNSFHVLLKKYLPLKYKAPWESATFNLYLLLGLSYQLVDELLPKE